MDRVKTCACECGTAPTLIFPCSGGSDTGEITDRAARKLAAEAAGKMFCLAGIGGRVSGIVESTRAAGKILAIDGCPQDCARKTLELAGFSSFRHLRVTDLGMKKGSSPASPERIGQATRAGRELLNHPGPAPRKEQA